MVLFLKFQVRKSPQHWEPLAPASELEILNSMTYFLTWGKGITVPTLNFLNCKTKTDVFISQRYCQTTLSTKAKAPKPSPWCQFVSGWNWCVHNGILPSSKTNERMILLQLGWISKTSSMKETRCRRWQIASFYLCERSERMNLQR